MTDEEIQERREDEIRGYFVSAVGHVQTSRKHLRTGDMGAYRRSRRSAEECATLVTQRTGVRAEEVTAAIERVADAEDRAIGQLYAAARVKAERDAAEKAAEA